MDHIYTSDNRAYFRCSLPAKLWHDIEQRGAPAEACRRLREALNAAAVRLATDPSPVGGSEAPGRHPPSPGRW